MKKLVGIKSFGEKEREIRWENGINRVENAIGNRKGGSELFEGANCLAGTRISGGNY